MTNRITFLVDGFNLYHSLKQAERSLNNGSTRWLDLQSLFQSYISIFGRGAIIEDIYYFSAMAKHMNHRKPGTTTKHANYIDILNATGSPSMTWSITVGQLLADCDVRFWSPICPS